MKLHELELPLIYDGLSFTLQRTYKARSSQWAAVVGFSVHISRTQPLTAEGASLLHTPSPWPWSSLCVTTHSSWSSETNSGASPLMEALFRPPSRVSHVFSCMHSTVHINDNAYKVAMILFLTTALHQTTL